MDDSRVHCIRWLRDPERRTAKSKVDSEFVKAKTELIAIRVREKKRELIELDEAIEVSEKLIGTLLTATHGMAPVLLVSPATAWQCGVKFEHW